MQIFVFFIGLLFDSKTKTPVIFLELCIWNLVKIQIFLSAILFDFLILNFLNSFVGCEIDLDVLLFSWNCWIWFYRLN